MQSLRRKRSRNYISHGKYRRNTWQAGYLIESRAQKDSATRKEHQGDDMEILGPGLVIICIGQILHLTRKVTRVEKNNETIASKCPLFRDHVQKDSDDDDDDDK